MREFSGEGRSFPSEDTKEIGRWLGVSDNDAEVVTYKILTDKGKVIHRADAMPLTEEEKKKEGSPEMKLLAEYDKKIDSYINGATVSFREDVKFADEGMADVHPSDTTRAFLNIIDNLDLEEQDPKAVDPSKLVYEKQFEDFDNVTPEAYDENLKKLARLLAGSVTVTAS